MKQNTMGERYFGNPRPNRASQTGVFLKKAYLGYLLPVACLFVLLVAAEVLAGGKEGGDLGIVAIGRGTAFVARADNLSAFLHNPAGLSKSKGPNLLLVGNFINQNMNFQRKGTGDYVRLGDNGKPDYSRVCTDEDLMGRRCVFDPDYDYSEGAGFERDFQKVSKSGFGPQPMLVFSWGGIGQLEDLALAVGIFPPPSFGSPGYDEKGPQRYNTSGSSSIALYPGVGASYSINRFFQIGAVFLSGFGFFEQSRAVRIRLQAELPDHNENLSDDAGFKLDLHDYFMPSGVVGVLSNPLDWLEIGVSVKLPVKIAPKGNVQYTAAEGDLDNSKQVPGRDKAAVTYQYPWMLRSGVRYIHPIFDVEVDFVWENWSNFVGKYDIDVQVDTESRIIDFITKGEFVSNYRDTYSVRLGSDIEVWPEHITLRAGGFYTSTAYPENYETFAVGSPYGVQFGVTGGLTWHVFRLLDINIGYMHVFQLDINVKEGIVQQMGPGIEEELPDGTIQKRGLGNIVNNGSYQMSVNTFGASVQWRFF
ncbi:MAG: hypothetical protein GY847_23385 [Proteobacteria bacterium]|nr:hypothetical protein [Pseudomonadota bacterium]